jgi:hypothetical protein
MADQMMAKGMPAIAVGLLEEALALEPNNKPIQRKLKQAKAAAQKK